MTIGRSPALRATLAVHSLGAVVALLLPNGWRPALAAVAVNHVALAAGSLAPRSALFGPNLRRLSRAARERGEVALTFDDGPDPEVTPRVLESLAAAGAGATFFCVGERARHRPELVRDVAAAGHSVANHTMSHRWHFALHGSRSLDREIEGAQRVLEGIARTSGSPFFRPPAGFQTPLLEPVLAARGMRLVSWTRRGFDAVDDNGRRVAERLTRRLEPGDILVLHDRRVRGDTPAVIDALPRVLEALRARGLRSVALASELAPARVEAPEAVEER